MSRDDNARQTGHRFLEWPSETPVEDADECVRKQGIWFYNKREMMHYKPPSGPDANEQILNCSSGRAAFNLFCKQHLRLEGIDASDCHMMEGDILIASAGEFRWSTPDRLLAAFLSTTAKISR